MPLLAQGETVGALHLVLTNNDVNHDEELLNTVSEQIGLMLANIMLRSNLKDQAMRDHVTGLYNRRYMTESLEQSVSRAERNKDSIAVFMLDVDHFKRFNDNYGHDAGDHVLKVLAGILQRSVRKEDIVCRYGGEEFCIVCYNLQESGALQIARTIADRLSEQKLNLNQLTLGKITVSIGLSLMPVHANTVEGLLIKSAGEALYKAKNQGRDCVVVADISKTLVSQPLEKTTEIQRPA